MEMRETLVRPRPGPASGGDADLRRGLVHVVDDDDGMRRSLVLLLRAAGHETAAHASAEALLAALDAAAAPAPGTAAVRPGCAVVDVLMPGGMDGVALQAELARRNARLPVVVVTGHADVALAVRAMRAGAVDFVEKPYPKDRILAAVGEALAASALSTSQTKSAHASSATEAVARIETLTPRERMVLRSLVLGRPNKVIAHELGISPRTVEAHRAAIMQKLGVRSLAEAMRFALAAGVDNDAENG